jgi:hypothetical protein
MQAELSALEAELASRDCRAADLSRSLADLRARLGSSSAPPAQPLPGGRLGPGALPTAIMAQLGAPPGHNPEHACTPGCRSWVGECRAGSCFHSRCKHGLMGVELACRSRRDGPTRSTARGAYDQQPARS